MSKRWFVGSLVSAVASVAACSSSNKPPATPAPSADAGAPMDAGWGAPPPAMDAGAPALAADAGPTFFTGDAGAAVTTAGDAAMDAAIDLATTAAAAKAAPKMEKEGAPGRATLKEGEHFNMVVTLQPNRCYTFVGHSPAGNVTQLDLKLYGMPLMVEAGKSGAGDKNTPVIGKGAAALCPLLPVAVPYKVDAVATKGAGRIGVTVYARNK